MLHIRNSRSVALGVLDHADGRERVGAQLVEAEVGRHGEGRFGSHPALFLLPRDLANSSGECEYSCRRGRDRLARELLRPSEVLADRLLLTPVPEHACEVGLGLGRPLGVADGEKGIACLLEGGQLTRFVVCPVQRERSPEQQLGAFRIVVGPEGERIVELRGGDREAVEGQRAIPCGSECQPRAFGDVVVVPTRRAYELERRAPVVGEHLGVVGLATETAEPLCNGSMPLSTVGTRDLAIRDVAHERVRERELALPFE